VVQEEIKIINILNCEILGEKKPFVVIGDLGSKDLKTFWFKVKCTYCGEYYQLCPPVKKFGGQSQEPLWQVKIQKCL
jgi:hypothetical protein